MTPCTFVRYDGVWRLWLRYTGIHLAIWVGDYGSRADALQAAATIDGVTV